MFRLRPFVLWRALLGCVSLSTVWGQIYPAAVYTEDQGLPSTDVADLAQDARGRIWFATRNGLAAYDGFNWAYFGGDSHLEAASFFRLKIDASGRIWAMNRESQPLISVFDGETWRHLPPAPKLDALREHLSGFAVSLRADRQMAAFSSLEQGVYVWRGDAWRNYDERHGLPSRRVYAVHFFEDAIYAALDDGLYVIEGDRARPFRLADGRAIGETLFAFAFAEDERGEGPSLWLLGHQWISKVQDGVLTRVCKTIELAPTSGSTPALIKPDRFGGVFWGDAGHLFYLAPGEDRPEQLSVDNGLAGNGATAVVEDREGNVWISGRRGVAKFPGFRFANFDKTTGLLADEVTAILELGPRRLLFGHNFGLTFYDNGVFRPFPFPGATQQSDVHTRCMDLELGEDGTIWIGASRMGLGRLTPGSDRIEWHAKDRGVSGPVAAIQPAPEGVWTATGNGLFLFSNGRFQNHPLPHPKASWSVRNLTRDEDGALYLAGPFFGLMAYKDGKWTRFDIEEQSRESNAFVCYIDRRGDVWLGGRAGLARVRGRGLEPVDIPELGDNRSIYSIMEDHRGRFWLGTDNGVAVWDGKKARRFTIHDGLAGRENNRAAALMDRPGRIWLGFDNGLTLYREAFDAPNHAQPLLWWDDLEVSDRALSLAEDHRLGYRDRDLYFNFQAVSFIDENAIQYQTWLEGFDASWLEPARYQNLPLRYTNLPPGDYRLHVRARSAAGSWSEDLVSGKITILKPYWLRWPFLAAILAALLGLALAAQHYWHAMRTSRLLRRRVEEQTRDLAAKNVALRQELDHRIQAEWALNLAKERAEAGSRAKSEFLATMSHEIRTPLNGVICTADMLAKTRLDLEQKEMAGIIKVSGEALLAVINDILDFSKIEANKIELEQEAFSLPQVLEETLEILKYKAQENKVAVSIRIDPDTPRRIVGDRTRLRQVLLNLMSNAIKFTRDGEAEIAVSPAAGNCPGPDALRLHFCVRDTGIGIAPDQVDRLFKPFSQADSSISRKFGGTGLGLAIARRLTHLMDGEIWAENRGSGGAAFHFTALVARAPKGAVADHAPVRAESTDAFAGLRVLLAEDNRMNRKIMLRVLSKFGLEPDVAENGVEAVAALQQKPYDLILMDVQMPEMDGLEATRQIVARWGEAGRPRIIACTANAAREDRRRCLGAGMDDFIAKPINPDKIRAALERWGALRAPAR